MKDIDVVHCFFEQSGVFKKSIYQEHKFLIMKKTKTNFHFDR